MSTVLSFRLCRENRREANAQNILDQWREDGYSLRHTLTEAILRLENDQFQPRSQAIEEDLLETLQSILQKLRVDESADHSHRKQRISENFFASLKMSIKPGLKIS